VDSPLVHHSQTAVTRLPFQAPPELAAAIRALATPLMVARGERVFAAGDPAAGVYLVTEGTVRAFLPGDNGRELVCRTLSAGSLLGVPAAMCAKSYQFTAEACDNVSLSYLETAAFNDMLCGNTSLCMQVVSMMSDELTQIRQTHDHMRSCTNTSCSLHAACARAAGA
jgi:CRP-like cAMP-binding protein